MAKAALHQVMACQQMPLAIFLLFELFAANRTRESWGQVGVLVLLQLAFGGEMLAAEWTREALVQGRIRAVGGVLGWALVFREEVILAVSVGSSF